MSIFAAPRLRGLVMATLVATLGLSMAAPPAQAELPRYISFQGRLTDADDNPLNDDIEITYRLYTVATDGEAVWTETQSTSVTNGIFHSLLGSVTEFTTDFKDAYWLSIEIEQDGEMSPRQRVTAVAYALNADALGGVRYQHFLRSDVDDAMAGTISFEGPAVDLTTAVDEDLTIDPAGTGDVVVQVDTASSNFRVTNGSADILKVTNEKVIIAGDVEITGALSISDSVEFPDDTINPTSLDDAYDEGASVDVDVSDVVWDLTSTADFVVQDDGSAAFSVLDTGNTLVSGDLEVVGATDLDGDLVVTGTSAFTDALDIDAIVDVAVANTDTALTVTQGGTGDAASFVGGAVRIGSGGTNNNATGSGEVYIQNDLEVDGVIYGTLSSSTGATDLNDLTVNGTLTANGPVTLGDGGDVMSINTSDWNISSTGAMTGISDIAAGANEDLTLDPNGTGDVVLATDGSNTQLFFSSTKDVALYRNAADQLRTPDSLIADSDLTTFADVNINQGNALRLAGDGSAPLVKYDGTNVVIEGAAGVNFNGLASDITTGTNEHLALMPAGAGRVGIGTTGPSAMLDVEQTGTVKATLDAMELTNAANAADMDATETALLFNQWYFDASTPAVADAARLSVGTEADWTSTASTQDSYFAFATAGDGTVAERMRLTSAGNLGIGTVNPSSPLTVAGDIRMVTGSGAQLFFADGTSMSSATIGSANAVSSDADAVITADADDDGSGDVLLKTGSNTRVTVLNGGNVGIGTSAPSSLLDIEGGDVFIGTGTLSNASVSEDLSVTGNLEVDGTIYGTLDGSVGITHSFDAAYDDGSSVTVDATDVVFNLAGSQDFHVQDAGTAALTVTDGGAVGIGLTNPAFDLEVSGNTHVTGTLTAGTIDGDITGDADTVDGFHASATPTANTLVALDASADLPANTVPTAALEDDAVTAAKLSVVGIDGTTGKVTAINTTNFTSLDGSDLTNLHGSAIATGTVADARIAATIARDTEITYETLDTNGDVGLAAGQLMPGDTDHWVDATGDSMTGVLTFSGVAGDLTTDTNEHLALMPNGTGQVGIGITNPAADLHLQGNLNIALTGTVSVDAGTAAVSGSGTAFDTELVVGDAIEIGAEIFTVQAIGSATALTLDGNHTAGASSVTASSDSNLLVVANGDGVARLTLDKSGTLTVSTIAGDLTGDADTVDGFHASATPTPNTLIALDGSADLPANTVATGSLENDAVTAAKLSVVGIDGTTGRVTAINSTNFTSLDGSNLTSLEAANVDVADSGSNFTATTVEAVLAEISDDHIEDTNNPHSVTFTQVGAIEDAADTVKESHLDFGTGADQIAISNFPEGTNTYVDIAGDIMTGSLTLPQDNDAAAPTLTFGDGDSGLYESTDDDISVSLAGSMMAAYSTAVGGSTGVATIAGGNWQAAMMSEVVSSTNPVLVPSANADVDTGIGSAGADQLSLIAGGTEMFRLGATDSYIASGDFGIGQSAPTADLHLTGNLDTALTGTVLVNAGTAAVVGTGTDFDTELAAGDALQIGAEIFTVQSIVDATNLTLDSNHVAGASGALAYSDSDLLVIATGDGVDQLTLDKSGNLTVDGTLTATTLVGGTTITGTQSDSFEIDTDDSSTTPTLTFGANASAAPRIETQVGDLTIAPASPSDIVLTTDATNTQLFFSAAKDVALYRNAADQLRTPDTMLVDGDVTTFTDVNVTQGNALRLAGDASAPLVKYDGTNIVVEGATGVNFNGLASDISTGTNEDFAIMPNGVGNVGIGVTNPGALLDVQGAAQFGSGNVDLIDATGQLAGLTDAYVVDLDGSDLVSLEAANVDVADSGSNYTATTVEAVLAEISDDHIEATTNPHSVTFTQVGAIEDADDTVKESHLDFGTGADQIAISDVPEGTNTYVDIAGDTMSGALNLPVNGLVLGIDQLVAASGQVGIGLTAPTADLHVRGNLDTALSGTVSVTAGTAAVTGTGTAFDTELSVDDALQIGTEVFTVQAIGSATALTLDSNHAAGASGVTAYTDSHLWLIQNGDAVAQLTLDKSGTLTLNAQKITNVADPTADQDAATKAYVDAAMGSSLSGSGTLNYLAKWTPNGSALGDSQMFDDGTSIGIGTTNPSAMLEISKAAGGLGDTGLVNIVADVDSQFFGASAQIKNLNDGTNPFALLRLEQGNANQRGDIFTYKPRGRDLTFRTNIDKGFEFVDSNSSALVTLLANGNFGIGTTNPTNPLHVSVSGSTSPLVAERTGANAARFEVQVDSNSLALYQKGNEASDTWTSGVQVDGYYISHGEGFGTDDFLKITELGHFGFGTTNPSADLHVRGNLDTALSGTVLVNAGTAAVVGTSTAFDTELAAGDALQIGAEIFTVQSITDATNLTLDSNHVAGASGATAYSDSDLLIVANGDGVTQMSLDKSGLLTVSTIAGDVTGDADTVDGFHASATPTANTLIALDASADLPADTVPTAALEDNAVTAAKLSVVGIDGTTGKISAINSTNFTSLDGSLLTSLEAANVDVADSGSNYTATTTEAILAEISDSHIESTSNPHAVTYAQVGAIQDAADTVKESHLDFGTGADQVAVSDFPEGTNTFVDVGVGGDSMAGLLTLNAGLTVTAGTITLPDDSLEEADIDWTPGKLVVQAEYPDAITNTTSVGHSGTLSSGNDGSGSSWMNFYAWRAHPATSQEMQLIVRLTLPPDFQGWALTDAIMLDYVTETTASADANVDIDVYLESSATPDASSVDNASSVAATWTTASIDDSVLGEWDAAGETAVVVLTLSSKQVKYVKVGDITLNYVR